MKNTFFKIVSVLCGAAVLCGFAGQTTLALSPAQKKVLQTGVYYFNTESSPARACVASTALSGSESAEKIWYFLVGKGLTPVQAAGVMGNLQAESGFNPKRVQGTKTPDGDKDNITVDGKTGYGLAQWTDRSRQQNLDNFAKGKGTITGDLATQLDFLYAESNPGGARSYAWRLQQQQTDVRKATYAWEDNYENPKKAHAEIRVQFAQENLAKYGSNTGGGTNSGEVVGCSGGSGEVVGGYSLPVDKHWYDEHPEWFSEKHHDTEVASDIPVETGTNVYSMTDGKIISAPTDGDCGKGVQIDAGNGILIVYCHGSDGGAVEGAKKGDTVHAGQLIMHSASTGKSTGPHLHVGIKTDGQARCPQPLFKSIADGSPADPKSLPTSGCTER